MSWDSGLNISYHSEIWHAPRQPRCRDICQISERYDNFNICVIAGGGVALTLWGPRSKPGSSTWSNSHITGNYPDASARRHVLTFPQYKNTISLKSLRGQWVNDQYGTHIHYGWNKSFTESTSLTRWHCNPEHIEANTKWLRFCRRDFQMHLVEIKLGFKKSFKFVSNTGF